MKINPNNLFVNSRGQVMVDEIDTDDTDTAYKPFIAKTDIEAALRDLIIDQFNKAHILKSRIVEFNQAFENLKETL